MRIVTLDVEPVLWPDETRSRRGGSVVVDSSDLLIDGSGTRIAVRDFGGVGDGIILVHGLSRTLADWNVMAPLLGVERHVVAMDLRGHGLSGDGPWSWNAAVEDVEAVAEYFDMRRPAVVGHSLGGMIASIWGRDHPDSAGVVSLDGHGNPRADQYVGLDPIWVAERRAELEALQSQQLAALSGPLSDAAVEALATQQKAVAAKVGAPEGLFVEGLRRALVAGAEGAHLRPAPDGLGAEIYASLDAIDMFSVYQEVRCPLLLFNAVDAVGRGGAPMGLSWISQLTSAFREGQTRDLRSLADRQENVQVETVDGSHGLLFEQSSAIAAITLDFLSKSTGS